MYTHGKEEVETELEQFEIWARHLVADEGVMVGESVADAREAAGGTSAKM